MSDSLADLSLTAFADALAAKRSVPGGGAAAALAGALAAALCSMVGEFTLGKRRYADVEDDVRRMLGEAERLRRRLVGLVDEDAAAFEPLSRAYGIPKEDPVRPAALEEATRAACAAPLETMRQCAAAVELLEEMGAKGSRMLLSDVGCGAELAAAALRSASMNVFVNTRPFAGSAWAGDAEREARDLLGAYGPRADALAQGVARTLMGGE